jgi:hypothetical protein
MGRSGSGGVVLGAEVTSASGEQQSCGPLQWVWCVAVVFVISAGTG